MFISRVWRDVVSVPIGLLFSVHNYKMNHRGGRDTTSFWVTNLVLIFCIVSSENSGDIWCSEDAVCEQNLLIE